jgi:hypothetical protein
MAKQDFEKLARIIRLEMQSAVGKPSATLSRARTELKSAYLGEPLPGDKRRQEAGWSVAQDRSVLETVEWAKPSLMRVFASQEEIVRFEPRQPEGEDAAEEATNYINQVVFGSGAFLVVHDLIADALYQRVAWAKVWWDNTTETVSQEREGLTYDEALAWVVTQPSLEGVTIEGYDEPEDGSRLYRIKSERKEDRSGVKIVALPPERVIWSAESLDIVSARFCAHGEDKTRAELAAEGYPKDRLDGLPDGGERYPETDVQTRINEDQADTDNETERMTYRVYEAYIKTAGANGPERQKVVFAGDDKNIHILSAESWPMDRPPLFPVSSLPLPHSVAGLSLADLVMDIQRVRTELFRQLLDGLASGNQGELVVNKTDKSVKVDYDQLMNRRIGGVYETEGAVTITPLPVVSGVAEEAAAAVALTDRIKESRTGVGQQLQGLSADALQKTATGAAIMDEAVNQRLELIARILAEVFFKPAAIYALKLNIRHQSEPLQRYVKGRFLSWNPQTWDPFMDAKVSVGLGSGNQGRRVSGLSQIMALQEKIAGALGVNSPVRLTHIVHAAHKLTQALGFGSPEQFFGTDDDARKYEEMIMAEAQQNQGQGGQTPEERLIELEIKKGEAQVANRMKVTEANLAFDQRKLDAELEMEKVKLEAKILLDQAKMAADNNLKAQQAQADAELAVLKETLKASQPPAEVTPAEVIL